MSLTEQNTMPVKISFESTAKRILKYVKKYLLLALFGAVMSRSALPGGAVPFCISAVCAVPDLPPVVLLGVMAGNMFFDVRSYTLSCAISLAIRTALFFISKKGRCSTLDMNDNIRSRVFSSLVGALCAAFLTYSGGGIYEVLGICIMCCAAIIGTMLFSFFFDKRYMYTDLCDIGMMAVMISIALAFRGACVDGVPIDLTLSIFFTMLVSLSVGGAHGGVIGLVLGIICGERFAVILPIFGAAAGAFAMIGGFASLITSSAIFFCGCTYFFGIDGAVELVIPLTVGEAFSIVPYSMGCFCKRVRGSRLSNVEKMISDIKENDERGKIEMLSSAMMSLSRAFGEMTGGFKNGGKRSFDAMCRAVWRRHCDGCPIDCACHDIEELPDDDVIESVTSRLMSQGRAERDKISVLLGSKCPKTDEIISDINDGAVDIIERAMKDNVDIFSLDYESSATMLAEALAQSSGRYEQDKLLPEKLRRALLGIGVATENVVVCGDRKKYVIATGDGLLRAGVGADDIRDACENVCRVRFKTPSYVMDNGTYAVTVEGDARFFTEHAGRQCRKRGEEFMGDSVSHVENRDGYAYFFICDGMGSGDIASKTADICRIFLEKMLKAGNSRSSTLEMLNTFVRNKGVECYATVDLLEIDLMLGTASFVKSGATPSYVKRGKNIFKIDSGTFPIGIMRSPSAEMTEFELCDGDVMILCSDGVAHDFDLAPSLDPSWFVSFIENEWTDDLDLMADKIISASAAQNHRGDDMTVELIRIRKR